MKLQLQNISKQYKGQKGIVDALVDINFEAQTGEFICLVGPSGCGKSTILNLISGLEKPTEGTVIVEGRLGLMFQEPGIFPWLTVRDNISFGLRMADKGADEIAEQVDHFIQMVHLDKFADSYPHELSGGMKQRVALARTLILDPDILLMDEPFAALDAQTREMLYTELQHIWQITKKTIVFITHDVREAVCLGDRVVVMGSHPGTIKKEFAVGLPRPRDIGSVEVSMLSNEVKAELGHTAEIIENNAV